MALALSSLPCSSTHQVFPSFCGKDVRKGFLSHLLKEFKSKGITPFIDHDDVERSKSIVPELIEVIKGSRISIVLISKNYASSTWWLDELVVIMKCREESSQTVMAIFYEVDPSDVKKQRGYFGAVFEKTCVGETVENVEKWKQALENVAKIAGYDSSSWKNEADMIENIAADVSNILNKATQSSDFDGLVGIEAHITELSSLLSLDSNDVRMVGIWGPAGIGKTTIARALFSKLSHNFTHTAFMESARGSKKIYSDDHAFMLRLQEQLLFKTFNRKDMKIGHLGVEERLKDKKVLVVLDDVDESRQLKAMACKNQWFGCGSRIIITTKDTKLLQEHGINHIYHVGFPFSSEAREILCLSAFGQKYPYVGFEDLTMEVIGLAGDLPLGLSVFGSYLRGMSKKEWIHALPRLRTSLDGNIEKVLRFSYEALCDTEKDLFLHIACFFKGESTSYLELCLAESDLNVRHGLRVLAEKSLIVINEEQSVVMHNLVEQLGKEIVRKEYKDEPGRRKFLVNAREICDVLADNTGSGTVLGIDLNLTVINDELSIDERVFERMHSLQFLVIYNPYIDDNNSNNKLILPRGLNSLPRKLRVLHWHKFPMRFLPPKFRAEFLIILEMQNSSLEKLWDGAPPFRCLCRVDLSYSLNLKEVPDLSNAPNLEVLILDGCENLVEIPSSISIVTSHQTLNHQPCSGLEGFCDISTTVEELVLSDAWIMSCSNLDTFSMERCHSLEVFPDVPNRIEVLNLSETGIEEVPRWIQNLTRLTDLKMVGCEKLKLLPTNINLESLSSLSLSHCTQLKMFPEISTSIKYLYLENTGIEEVPSSIRSWPALVELNMRGCKSLKVFPNVLDSMEKLDLSRTGINLLGGELEAIPDCTKEDRSRLRELIIFECENLVSLPQLPTSLSYLYASDCELLETIDGFFNNSQIDLNFVNCLKLNDKAKKLIQTSASITASLPCGEVPSYFHHQGTGSSLTIPLIDDMAFPKSMRFKACILLAPYLSTSTNFGVSWCVSDESKGPLGEDVCYFSINRLVTDHLLTFEASFSLEDGNDREVMVTCSELLFAFEIIDEERFNNGGWERVEYDSPKLTITGCGVRFLDVHGEEDGFTFRDLKSNVHKHLETAEIEG